MGLIKLYIAISGPIGPESDQSLENNNHMPKEEEAGNNQAYKASRSFSDTALIRRAGRSHQQFDKTNIGCRSTAALRRLLAC